MAEILLEFLGDTPFFVCSRVCQYSLASDSVIPAYFSVIVSHSLTPCFLPFIKTPVITWGIPDNSR